MSLVRSYLLTGSNPTKVTDFSSGSPVDMSDKYNNIERKAGVARITASLTVYRDDNGDLTPVPYSDSTSSGLLDLGVLMNMYAEDRSKADGDERRLE